jgi:adenine deaminase
MDIQRLMAVSLGKAPAELLFKNGKVVNTFIAQIEETDVAVSQGLIVGLGQYNEGENIIDLNGSYLAPAFIDGHIHLESSFVTPVEYARAVVPRGVLAVITDFHEIANVCGRKGIEYMFDCSRHLPLDIFGLAPSCVPATNLETSGARLDVDDLKKLRNLRDIIGLGEMMNFPGVISAEPDVWEKIGLFQDKVIDGHAPGLIGNPLNAYLMAGIRSDHECTAIGEALEKLKRGMHIMIREGSSEKNLDALFSMINHQTLKQCFFVVDDRSCTDLFYDGDVDAVVRRAIQKGLDPIWAIQMATINPAQYFRLDRLGAIAPGYHANLMILDDLKDIEPKQVFYHGQLVAEHGRLNVPVSNQTHFNLNNTVHIKPLERQSLKIRAKRHSMPVIEIVPDQIITRKLSVEPKVREGYVLSDIEKDVLKLAVVERHKETGNVGLGLVKGFGLKRGAISSSVAHDSHNIIAVGTNDDDIFHAIVELERLQGGLIVVAEGRTLGSLPLPIAGLLSDEPLERVVQQLNRLKQLAVTLGCIPSDPFAVLSFLALPVIPEIRLTDRGLVDVMAF